MTWLGLDCDSTCTKLIGGAIYFASSGEIVDVVWISEDAGVNWRHIANRTGLGWGEYNGNTQFRSVAASSDFTKLAAGGKGVITSSDGAACC